MCYNSGDCRCRIVLTGFRSGRRAVAPVKAADLDVTYMIHSGLAVQKKNDTRENVIM